MHKNNTTQHFTNQTYNIRQNASWTQHAVSQTRARTRPTQWAISNPTKTYNNNNYYNNYRYHNNCSYNCSNNSSHRSTNRTHTRMPMLLAPNNNVNNTNYNNGVCERGCMNKEKNKPLFVLALVMCEWVSECVSYTNTLNAITWLLYFTM